MSSVDLILLALVLLFAVSGYRQGFLIGALSFGGFFTGALIGLQLGPRIAQQFTDAFARVVVSLVAVFGLAIIGQALAAWVGSYLRHAIRSRTGRKIDDLGGALISALAVLLVAWLVAVPLGSSSLPWLAASVRNSALLRGVDRIMPEQAQTFSEALRDTVDTNGFPNVFGQLSPTRVRDVPPPDPALAGSEMVAEARRSVVKVLGSAPSCSRRIEGSGFVYAGERVMTNAHVVAGTRSVEVELGRRRYDARVVVYDPNLDLAVLYVPGLPAPSMRFSAQEAQSGADAVVLGFPLDGPFNAQSARIRDLGEITGPNIYESRNVTREVYTIRAPVRSGNSGGPLVDPQGRVLGVIFAAAADDDSTGFAVSADEAMPVAAAGARLTQAVATGRCV
ncbi:MAG TPA: MarP family serine protease [Micromonosporaceae bacterium]